MKNYTFRQIKNNLLVKIQEISILLEEIGPNQMVDECYKLVEIIKKRIKINNHICVDEESIKEIEIALAESLSILIEVRHNLKGDNSFKTAQEQISALDFCYSYLVKIDNVLSLYKTVAYNIHAEEYETFNSDSFYNQKIKDINREKEELTKEINTIKEILESRTDESEKVKKELEKKEQELHKSINLISKYEAEKLQNEKINDAKKEWNGKIVAAFENLKKYIKPIKDEHRRLGFLFWGYLGISVVIVLCLFIIEYIVCCKIESVNGFPTWETYLSLIAPIPIAMGGLWGFVTLMHRVQRQLVILAKQIHEIEYVEGLLLTTNTLSTNINESMSKVNLAIEKLLENHLRYDSSALAEELSLEKEEKKDAMPYEEVLKLVEKVAGMVSKNKE